MGAAVTAKVHWARIAWTIVPATLAMYLSYPEEIRRWIDINGGPRQLTPNGWWTLYARELWAMGYPKCK